MMDRSFGRAFIIGGLIGVLAQQAMRPDPMSNMMRMGRRAMRKGIRMFPVIKKMM